MRTGLHDVSLLFTEPHLHDYELHLPEVVSKSRTFGCNAVPDIPLSDDVMMDILGSV